MKCTKTAAHALVALLLLSLSALPLSAQDTPVGPEGTSVATEATPAAAVNSDALRNAAQNPVASLISVPVQENWNFGIQPGNRTQNVLNIQPVIPLSLGKKWNLITRWITPIIYQPIPVPQPSGPPVQQTGVYGLGDLNPSFFLSPKKSKVIWGIGPTFVLPTATNTTFLGQGKFSIGPTVVVLVQPTHWTIGFLANNYWSVAGHSDLDKPAVNQFLLQWFANYNMKKGWYLTTGPIITANWRASSGNVWVVPFGGGVGRIMKLGFQPVNITAQFYGNAVHPPGASPWTMKMQIAFLFPKLTKEQEKMLLEQKLKQMNQPPPQKK
ncbi:MAG: neuromedin U [Candidatus Sulfotelmatobacter sp.]